MGILLMIVGLAAAGVVADFLIENGLGSGVDQAFDLFGGTFRLSPTELALGSAVLGAIAITFVALGLGLLGVSLGRRRERRAEFRDLQARMVATERRNNQLERENADLRRRISTAPAAAAAASPAGTGQVVDVREPESQRHPM